MNIFELKAGDRGVIESIDGSQDLKNRLMSMGFHPGREIKKLGSAEGGAVIIEVMGSQVALGRGMASEINVVPLVRELFLTGNPNVGKSVVFSRLTGLNVVASNYPGTTVEYLEGSGRIAGERFKIVDVPGAYSLAPACRAEDIACRLLSGKAPDIVINAVDATNLERNLFFTLQLLEKKLPLIILLNKSDIAALNGIAINAPFLAEKLGVPVVPFVAVSGEGLKELENAVFAVLSGRSGPGRQVPAGDDDKWKLIGELSRSVQTISHKHPSFLERLAELSVMPLTGIPIAAGVIIASFLAIRGIAEGSINYVLSPLFDRYYLSFLFTHAPLIKYKAVRDFLVGATPNVMDSFGLLTTGVYIPFISVLPYIVSFYLALGFIEDIGYLPRLAVLLDRYLHKIGLHGYGAIPVMLGIGCKVPGMLATRVLETRRERIIAITLVLLIAPCMPQSAMIFSILAPYGLKYLMMVFGTVAFVGLLSAFILNRMILEGESSELFVEIPPYQWPDIKVLAMKLRLRVKNFLVEAVPLIILGIALMGLLENLGIMNAIEKFIAPAAQTLLGLPAEITPLLVLGMLRKDVSIALLIPFGLGPGQIAVAAVFLVLYAPCAATFFILLKEVGWKDAARIMLGSFFAALIVAGMLHLSLVLAR